MTLIAIALAVIMAGTGFILGWQAATSRRENQHLDAIEAAIRGRHARAWPRLATTAELTALYDPAPWQSSKQRSST
jgi:hypothetical protein